MELKTNLNVRNTFNIKVSDVNTGEVKKEAKAYNTITKRFMSTIASANRDHLDYIQFGSGLGTPSFDNINLFTRISGKQVTQVSYTRNSTERYWERTLRIRLEANEFVGQTITEVGLATSTGFNVLETHAMIKDSEGNQISIPKTDTDVVDIYATVYVTLEDLSPAYGDSVQWFDSSGNDLFNNILDGRAIDASCLYSKLVNTSSGKIELVSSVSKSGPTVKKNYDVNGNLNGYTVSMRSTQSEHNFFIEGIRLSEIINMKFPIPGVLDHVDIIDAAVATGDGVTRSFTIPSADEIDVNNLVVKVDGAVVTPESVNGSIKRAGYVGAESGFGRAALVMSATPGPYLAAITLDDSSMLNVYDTSGSSLTKVSSFELNEYPQSVEFTEDFSCIIVCVSSGIRAFQVTNGVIGTEYTSQADFTNRRAAFSYIAKPIPGSEYFLYGPDGGSTKNNGTLRNMFSVHLDKTNLIVGSVVQDFDFYNNVSNHEYGWRNMAYTMNADGTAVYISTYYDGVYKIALEPTTGVFGAAELFYASSNMTGGQIAFSHKNWLAIKSKRKIVFFDETGAVTSETTIPSLGTEATLQKIAVSPDGFCLATIDEYKYEPGYAVITVGDGTASITAGDIVRNYNDEFPVSPCFIDNNTVILSSYDPGRPERDAYRRYAIKGTGLTHFTLATPPAAGQVITADFRALGVPKTDKYLLDVSATFNIVPE